MKKQAFLAEGWSTLFLLLLLLSIAALTISQAEFTEGTHILGFVGIVAVLAGLFLAKSNFTPGTAHLYAFLYGLFTVLYLVGTILPTDMSWQARIIDLVQRQVDWLQKAIGGGTSRDGLVFVLQTAFIFWLLGYTAAWYTFRQPRVWRVIIPTGLVLFSVVYYYYGPRPLLYYLAAYIAVALVFIARTHLITQEREWQGAAVRYEPGIRYNFLRAGLLAALVLLIAAYPIPTLSASPAVNDALSVARGPWRGFQETWTRLFSALQVYGLPTSDPYQTSMSLGGPRTVSNDLVMDIYVAEEMPNLYWKAIALDSYRGGGWTTTVRHETSLHIPDDGLLPISQLASREVVTQTVINFLPNSSFLYAAPELIGSDRQMYVDATQDQDGNMLVAAVRSRFIMRQGDQYQVISNIPNVDIESLRTAPTRYPAWVEATYLQVPPEITPETLELASRLTAPYDNVYDKATAVQDYLRQAIRYNDQISAAPRDVDPIHYTLFVSREAYCTYYASAMAIMLRSQGIPTRIVNGYVQGEYDPLSRSYRVRASDAHTWVEVYFPNYGWIQFEPTASLPVPVRAEPAAALLSDETDARPSPQPIFDDERPLLDTEAEDDFLADMESGAAADEAAALAAEELESWWQRLPLWQTAVALLILAIAFALTRLATELNQRVEADVNRSYSRLEMWAGWLGLQFRSANTPYERAEMLETAVPEGKSAIHNLIQQFVLLRFSPRRDTTGSFDSLAEWRVLRPLLLRQSIRRRVSSWFASLRPAPSTKKHPF
jgi:transglutaminase-like putative cysteine protease